MAPKKSKPTKDDDNNDDLQFPDSVRALISALKLDVTLFPSTTSVAKATFGPTFLSHFPNELSPYYPLANSENLLLNQT